MSTLRITVCLPVAAARLRRYGASGLDLSGSVYSVPSLEFYECPRAARRSTTAAMRRLNSIRLHSQQHEPEGSMPESGPERAGLEVFIAVSIDTTDDELVIRLVDREVRIPWERCSPILAAATAEDRRRAELSPAATASIDRRWMKISRLAAWSVEKV